MYYHTTRRMIGVADIPYCTPDSRDRQMSSSRIFPKPRDFLSIQVVTFDSIVEGWIRDYCPISQRNHLMKSSVVVDED
jgi:hypothetical protein